MTAAEPDARERPATLDLIEDLITGLTVIVGELREKRDHAQLLHDDGIWHSDAIDARYDTELRPILDTLVDAVRRAGETGVR